MLRLQANFLRSQVQEQQGNQAEVERELEATAELAVKLGQPEVEAAFRFYRAIRLWDAGRREEALALAEEGLEKLEALADTMPSDAVGTGFRASLASRALYDGLLKMLLERGDHDGAFELTARAGTFAARPARCVGARGRGTSRAGRRRNSASGRTGGGEPRSSTTA
jgi:hypothetical protein